MLGATLTLGRVETDLLSRTLPIGPQHTGETRCLWNTMAPPTSALRDYGLASQARETDGDGAPIFTPEFPKADPYLFGKGRVAWSLNQIVKKVGTPRHRCPKHQA